MSNLKPFHIVLFQPEIPQNTGNIMRLCANTGAQLDLIEPLGFHLNTKSIKRAGLDYIDPATIHRHRSFDHFIDTISPEQNIVIVSTKAHTCYTDIHYPPDTCFLFGQESAGLPNDIHQHSRIGNHIRIPMQDNSRSLNLSNSVAVVCYELLRQHQFKQLI